ncbi:MAG TPA: cupin domain-containing protein [Solirubrobacteraceae bacterium]|nr:cupin domain-containing protein [Solirubrobacteraceae bacterium]
MSAASLMPPGGGEIIGDTADRRVAILSDHDALHVTHSRFGPRREGADLHVHRRHADFFYVLDGELTVRLGPGDELVSVPAGALARVPPLVVHGFRNASDADVSYLNLHAPGARFADYLRALRDGAPRPDGYDQEDPPDDGGRPVAEAQVGAVERLEDGDRVRVELLADGDEAAVARVLREAGDSSPVHVHERHVEAFYVLEGELLLTVGGEETRVAAGTWAQVAPGVAHTVANPEPARFLTVHAPNAGFGRFLRATHVDGLALDKAIARTGFDERPAA